MSPSTKNITPVDSIADTVKEHNFTPHYLNGFNNDHYKDTTISRMSQSDVLIVPRGERSIKYISNPLHDTGTMILFLLSIFLITISYRKGFKYVANFSKNLFSLKTRENVFEDHNTVNEMQILIALIANTCIMEGILINCTITQYFPAIMSSTNIFLHITSIVGIMVLFYFAQLYAYYILAYVFTNKVNASLLLKGFNASQAILGLLLVPVVIFLLVYPSYANIFITIFCALYILCRIIFIIKGLRIFYNNFFTILLFILYLCSGEIIPIIAIFSGIKYMFNLL